MHHARVYVRALLPSVALACKGPLNARLATCVGLSFFLSVRCCQSCCVESDTETAAAPRSWVMFGIFLISFVTSVISSTLTSNL
jgi:hypothetical protein